MKILPTVCFAFTLLSCTSKMVTAQNISSQPANQSTSEVDVAVNKKAERIRHYNDSLNTAKQWKLISGDLYISKDGDIGIIDARLLIPPDDFITVYQYTFCDQNRTPLNAVIDVKSFKFLAGSGWGAYYRDKNHIYHSFGTSGGSNFSIAEEADVATFKILNDCYAKDKNHVYEFRFGIIEGADPSTFKYLKDDCYAKDKNGYYSGNGLLSAGSIGIEEYRRIKRKLDKL